KTLDNVIKGGYVLLENADADITLVATGSEVELAMAAAKELNARVVSMPCVELFRSQDRAYKAEVLGNTKRLAIEAGVTRGWYEFADDVVGINTFGASAPAGQLFEHFGFTVDNVIQHAQALLAN